jgi:hypothetical protein
MVHCLGLGCQQPSPSCTPPPNARARSYRLDHPSLSLGLPVNATATSRRLDGSLLASAHSYSTSSLLATPQEVFPCSTTLQRRNPSQPVAPLLSFTSPTTRLRRIATSHVCSARRLSSLRNSQRTRTPSPTSCRQASQLPSLSYFAAYHRPKGRGKWQIQAFVPSLVFQTLPSTNREVLPCGTRQLARPVRDCSAHISSTRRRQQDPFSCSPGVPFHAASHGSSGSRSYVRSPRTQGKHEPHHLGLGRKHFDHARHLRLRRTSHVARNDHAAQRNRQRPAD